MKARWHSQTQYSLYRSEECRDIECFEKDLGSCVSVLARVQWGLCEQYWMLLYKDISYQLGDHGAIVGTEPYFFRKCL